MLKVALDRGTVLNHVLDSSKKDSTITSESPNSVGNLNKNSTKRKGDFFVESSLLSMKVPFYRALVLFKNVRWSNEYLYLIKGPS